MTTELTLPTNATAAQINELFGFSSNKTMFPALKINSSSDDDGTTAPKGTYVYSDGERILHAKEVTIRVYLKTFQYRLFNADKQKNDSSIIANTMWAEFRSTSGRIACGKMSKKAYLELGTNATVEQKFYQDNAKCKLILFGVVSGTFTDLDTQAEVELKDALFMFVANQSSFMALDQAIVGISKERRAVPLTPIKLTLQKDKSGSVTYYIAVPEVLKSTAEFDTAKDSAHLAAIRKFVDDTNTYVEKKYNEALTNKNTDVSFANVGGSEDPLAFE